MNVSHKMSAGTMGNHGVVMLMGIIGIVSLTVQVTIYMQTVQSYYNLVQPFSVETCKTFGGDRDPCVFPFTYKGREHTGCITNDNDGTPWCDIRNGEKGNCTGECPSNLGVGKVIIMMT